jgi:hypothetical protein
MTAAHILVCLTQEGKSHEEIAREDFDNNLEMVCVWIDYMIGINWIDKKPSLLVYSNFDLLFILTILSLIFSSTYILSTE